MKVFLGVWCHLFGLVVVLIFGEMCSGRSALLVRLTWGRLCVQLFYSGGIFFWGVYDMY